MSTSGRLQSTFQLKNRFCVECSLLTEPWVRTTWFSPQNNRTSLEGGVKVLGDGPGLVRLYKLTKSLKILNGSLKFIIRPTLWGFEALVHHCFQGTFQAFSHLCIFKTFCLSSAWKLGLHVSLGCLAACSPPSAEMHMQRRWAAGETLPAAPCPGQGTPEPAHPEHQGITPLHLE